MLNSEMIEKYINILREELIPAMGCTEPIALAYGAAKAREILGVMPERCIVECSGNIIKNVKSVLIPGTEGEVGIEAAVIAGLVAGKSELGMEVLSELSHEYALKVKELLKKRICVVKPLFTDVELYIRLRLEYKNEYVILEIKDAHTNIVYIEKNGEIVLQKGFESNKYLGAYTDRSILSVKAIYEFANTVELEKVFDILKKQIECNYSIAVEGMKGNYGLGVGKVIIEECSEENLSVAIKAYTAAASEARMSGCMMPVVINSGSGNQGIAVSVPVIIYAKYKGHSEEMLYRALILSNLLAIHQKTLIGRLSAFCGVVSASCASGAAMTYLCGGNLEQINMTISNTLANTSGIICDGAKPSCGAKIFASLDAAYTAHLLAMRNLSYNPGEGIVKKDIEDTIYAIGKVARDGMKETDGCILSVMLEG